MHEEAMNEAAARSLAQHSNALLLPVEEAYLKNLQQQRLLHARQQQQQQLPQPEPSSTPPVHTPIAPDMARQPSLPLPMDQMNHGTATPHSYFIPLSSSSILTGPDINGRAASIPSEQPPQAPNGLPREDSSLSNSDNELKRKLQEEESFKRVRQRTGKCLKRAQLEAPFHSNYIFRVP